MATEKEKFAQRLNEALDEIEFAALGHGRQSELARVMEVPAQQAGRWLKGQSFPRTSELVRLARITGVRSNWLLSGAEPKHPPEERIPEPRAGGQEEEPPRPAKDALSREAFAVALEWSHLPAHERDAVRGLIRALARADTGQA